MSNIATCNKKYHALNKHRDMILSHGTKTIHRCYIMSFPHFTNTFFVSSDMFLHTVIVGKFFIIRRLPFSFMK